MIKVRKIKMAELTYAELKALAIFSSSTEYVATPITATCKARISKQFRLPEVVIDAYLRTENAPDGHIRTNTDGTYDVGPMQINSINWPDVFSSFGVDPFQIRFNGCMNLTVGTYLIRKRFDEIKKTEMKNWEIFYRVAANYHSKTPTVNNQYRTKWINNFKYVLENK